MARQLSIYIKRERDKRYVLGIRKSERAGEREGVCVFVCVCVREREKERFV